MWARYESVDGFEFKVNAKRWLDGLFGRIFGSRGDIDIGDPAIEKHYSVESNDADKVRSLLLGQEIRTMVDATLAAGYHDAIWNGRDNAGNQVASGVYLYRIRAGDFTEIKKLMLLR